VPIGRDLLDLPFAELVRNLAVAIADGQTALDRNSLDTLRELVATNVDVLTDVTEVISPDVQDLPVTVRDANGVEHTQTVRITGARITSSGAAPVPMNMLQAGLFPTFYQFTEATVEVKLAITMREDDASATSGTSSPLLGIGLSRAYASSVDFRTQNTYSYAASGSSTLTATLKPVPPPSRLQPTTTTINTFTSPPTITRV
jgi:hypothetical protein